MKILICFVMSTFIVGVIFTIQFIISLASNKAKVKGSLYKFLPQIVFLFFFVILYFMNARRIEVLNFDRLITPYNGILILLGVLPTSIMVTYEKRQPNKLLEWILLGVTMEVPQRLFSQNLILVILTRMGIQNPPLISVIVNALLWIEFIIIQDIMTKEKINRKSLPKLVSSLWFSLFIGLLYMTSGNILLPMIAHGLERGLSELLVRSRFNKSTLLSKKY